MARSSYCYVVLQFVGSLPARPVAAFTVKHELCSWMKEHEREYGLQVWRCPDGRYHSLAPSRMTAAELGL
jgi:hypothetical protein